MKPTRNMHDGTREWRVDFTKWGLPDTDKVVDQITAILQEAVVVAASEAVDWAVDQKSYCEVGERDGKIVLIFSLPLGDEALGPEWSIPLIESIRDHIENIKERDQEWKPEHVPALLGLMRDELRELLGMITDELIDKEKYMVAKHLEWERSQPKEEPDA